MDRAEIVEALQRMGARDPEEWADSEIDEDIPQLARFAFLKGAWDGVIADEDDSWMETLTTQTPADSDAPFAGTAHALRDLLDGGADRGALRDLVRGMQAELVFHLCTLLEDPEMVEGNDVVAWALFELDDDDEPKRQVDGLHESVLETDPTGREMRPR